MAATPSPAAAAASDSSSSPSTRPNVKEWLEAEQDVFGFFNVSHLVIILVSLTLACCILCIVLCCVRHHVLKCKRKKEEYMEGRKQRKDQKQTEKDKKEAIINGWDETIDQSTGASCYHNSVTNETTWEKPKGYRKKKKKQLELQLGINPMGSGSKGVQGGAAGAAHVRTQTVLPAGWSSEFSPEGYKFYHNPDTGEVTWSAPAGATGGSAALLAALDAASESTGHKRKETVLPAGWGAEFSPEGYKFYHHPETGEVTWTAPDGSTGGSSNKK